MNAARDELFGGDRRKAVATLLIGTVIVAVAVFFIGQVASFPKMLRALRHAGKVWFVVALAGEVVAYLGYIAA
ncbi:MAG TPA: hypothetical protein VF321_06330, partial [Gaiellaceae bacterium]